MSTSPLSIGAMDARAQDPRRRARAAGAAQGRARHLDRRDLTDHRGRARRHRFRPDARAALRAGPRADAAGDRARQPRQRRPAARPRRPRRARRLLPAVGGGGQRRPAPFAPPEILAADLSRLCARSCAMGRRRPRGSLRFLDPPPRAAFAEARALLAGSARSTRTAASPTRAAPIARLALPPRLARMLVEAARAGDSAIAAAIATSLSERGLGGDAVDLGERLAAFRRDRSSAPRTRAGSPSIWRGSAVSLVGRPSETRRRLARATGSPSPFPSASPAARGRRGEFLMANGRAAAVEPHDALARPDLPRRSARSPAAPAPPRILLAAAADARRRSRRSAATDRDVDEIAFDRGAAALRGDGGAGSARWC